MYSANVLGKAVCTAAGEPQFNAHKSYGVGVGVSIDSHTKSQLLCYIDFREAYLCFHQFQSQ